ncbi:MAG: MBL fold metallo-hydrolase [Planctomycetes bacterium]|nr:MBL fold metallo-hydrolase [Planctomycetota bacterium]
MGVNGKARSNETFCEDFDIRAAIMAAAEILHDNIRILGSSSAGEETYFLLPELGVAFDFGRSPRELIPIEHVFLTHGHLDHTAGLAYYFAQRWFVDAAPGNLYLAPSLIEPVRRLLRAFGEIDGHEPPARLHPSVPGVDIEVRRGLIVRPFDVNHFGPRTQRAALSQALGYGQKGQDPAAGMHFF